MMSEREIKELLSSRVFEKEQLSRYKENDFLDIWEFASIKDEIKK